MSSRRVMVSGALFVCSVEKDHVARQRRLDGRARGLEVAHFADHDDVRVAAQERAQRLLEREADLGLHADLAQAGLRDFDRVLGGPDLDVGLVQVAQRRVERGRLAGARRAHAEEDAVGLLHDPLEGFEVVLLHPELLDRDGLGGGQDAEHRVLHHPGRRDRGDAELDVARAVVLEADLSVLGEAPLRDVQVRHDLDARDHVAAELARQPRVVGADAVDADSNHEVAVEIGFDVDVARALVVGLLDDLVDEPHHAGVVFLDHVVGPALFLDLEAGVLALDLVDDVVERDRPGGLRLAEELVDELVDVLRIETFTITSTPSRRAMSSRSCRFLGFAISTVARLPALATGTNEWCFR
jgi:hypothetical protein